MFLFGVVVPNTRDVERVDTQQRAVDAVVAMLHVIERALGGQYLVVENAVLTLDVGVAAAQARHLRRVEIYRIDAAQQQYDDEPDKELAQQTIHSQPLYAP